MQIVAALYHFAPLPDASARRSALLALGAEAGLSGSLLLAGEGVNGTVAGPRAGIDRLLAHLRAWPGFERLEHKESLAEAPPFGRFKVKLKREIVTMGVPGSDPRARVGTYVAPQDWNALIEAPDVALIDTRNDYEVAIGSFEGADDPAIRRFRDFPTWWQEHQAEYAGKRIAMFCTGGIRCEKASNYLLSQGVEAVYHLKGGILKYLEEVPPEASRWQGQCYVFDGRVSVGQGLVPGGLTSCHACRRPLSAEDLSRPEYERGVACHHCANEYSAEDRARFRERQRQVDLAAARGQRHLGAGAPL